MSASQFECKNNENLSLIYSRTPHQDNCSDVLNLIISDANYDINSADVLESLGWQTLEERRKRNKSILMYRILNNRVAPNLKEQFTSISDVQVNYNMRSSSTDLLVPIRKRDFLKRSFKYSGAKLWNSLSTDAKLATSENVFVSTIYNMSGRVVSDIQTRAEGESLYI